VRSLPNGGASGGRWIGRIVALHQRAMQKWGNEGEIAQTGGAFSQTQ
jgi:hypothetical protein